MHTPFLSIITINYNQAEGLRKTLTSVAKQTFEDFELLVIDGGSTDGSKEVIEEFTDAIHYWVSEKDTGIYNAMNKGIAKANGTYLLFLNGGDSLTQDSILEQFINHPKFSGDIIYGDYLFEDGNKIYPDQLPATYFLKTSLPHQSTLFHHSVFKKMGLYDESYRIGADRAFFMKAHQNKQFQFTHIPCFLSLFDKTGKSNDPHFLSLKREEDERMGREVFGSEYEKYKALLAEELERNRVPKYSPKGIWKRIKKRLK